ncbi:MAG: nucleoside triphosphate pyrophosphohydrolase, partial [Bdellovibrionales bacterium]|nr:nucleoside triphosphate pyrophosphohydrolase [Bdellovibrionales bacterium]
MKTEPTLSWKAFLDIVAALRAPDGCPWDLEQTHRSLVPYAIEETFEMVEAIETGDDASFVEELGDVLLQVVLHAQIASETARFTIEDVVQGISAKMIRRHPHVFGKKEGSETAAAMTSADVLQNWQAIKAAEKAANPSDAAKNAETTAKTKKGFRFDIPVQLPALQRAAKIGEKTQRLRFDWPNWQGVLAKVEEEVREIREALNDSRTVTFVPKDHPETGILRDPVASEIGDALFSLAQLARHRGFDPEQCLREANARFERRF